MLTQHGSKRGLGYFSCYKSMHMPLNHEGGSLIHSWSGVGAVMEGKQLYGHQIMYKAALSDSKSGSWTTANLGGQVSYITKANPLFEGLSSPSSVSR